MKTGRKLAAVLMAALVLSGSFPASTVKAEETAAEQTTTEETAAEETVIKETAEKEPVEKEPVEKETVAEEIAEKEPAAKETVAEVTTENETTPEKTATKETAAQSTMPDELLPEEIAQGEAVSKETLPEEMTADELLTTQTNIDEWQAKEPDEPPAFGVHIKNWGGMGYVVIGTFTDFTPDIIRIDTLYSLDGKSWRAVTGGDWNLCNLGTDDGDELHALQNQVCLYNGYEPLKSYTAGAIDGFELKLRITKENGFVYETQSATIEHGGVQTIPEGTIRSACFSSDMLVRERVADRTYIYYGRYQITVPADAAAEEIFALLPDTLPVRVSLVCGRDFRVDGVVDCPVTWKPLSLPQFSSGETVTIPDAAEELIVPAGTPLSTPLGVYMLDVPLRVDAPPMTDEVRLVLNVSSEERNLAGVLKRAPDGLTVAFQQKPAGATSIEAYVLTEGESGWTELEKPTLLKEMNAQHSTESSGYALLLYNDEEPWRSYLEAQKAGIEPTPFFVGFIIRGGLYDDRQLILAWPDIYEELPDLPKVGRSEGNEGNAGAANKDDSTESGQRPNLPQEPDDKQDEQESNPSQTPDDKQDEQESNPSQTPDDKQDKQESNPSQIPDDKQDKQESNPPQIPDDKQDKQESNPPQTPGNEQDKQDEQKSNPPQTPGNEQDEQESNPPDFGQESVVPTAESASEVWETEPTESGQRPNLPRIIQNTVGDAPNAEQSGSAGEKDSSGLELPGSPAQPLTVVQAATVKKDEKQSHLPLLPVTAAAGAICIGAAVYSGAGFSLFRLIVGKIRKIMRRS